MVVYLILNNLKKAYFDDSAIECDHYFIFYQEYLDLFDNLIG